MVEMPHHLNLALDNGVKPAEISEIITHRVLLRLGQRDVGSRRRQSDILEAWNKVR